MFLRMINPYWNDLQGLAQWEGIPEPPLALLISATGSSCTEVWKEVWEGQATVQEKKKLKEAGGKVQRRELGCEPVANSVNSNSV